MKIRRALLSVSDKTGLVDFARRLVSFGVELISTGGTAKVIREADLPVREISDLTGFPEMLDGRLKSLHPKVHGGLLYRRGYASHEAAMKEHGIEPIDLVVVNLYPFEKTIAKEGVTLEEAIEQIDIGGPAMLRSAAKNHRDVTVVVDPADYEDVLETMDKNEGCTTLKLREQLAVKVFLRTAAYDAAIGAYLNRAQESTGSFALSLPLERKLRYGENPHQAAELYGRFGERFEQIHGKELSYNNILDIDAAARLIAEFSEQTVAILKHTNPCGVGTDADDQRAAWDKAFATDKQAPFGGIIICNRPLTEPLARAIGEIFSEVIIAPDFEPGARSILQKKKNLRLMILREVTVDGPPERQLRSVAGGVLVQDADDVEPLSLEERVVTQRPPTRDEIAAMHFGWKIVKHVKSNAIVLVGKDRTLGIGAGQMSRVDSCRIAVWKAQEAGLSLKGAVVASDAFFPFADGLLSVVDAGVTAAIQPGGSVRDEDVIKAADERGVAMVFTGVRHFKH